MPRPAVVGPGAEHREVGQRGGPAAVACLGEDEDAKQRDRGGEDDDRPGGPAELAAFDEWVEQRDQGAREHGDGYVQVRPIWHVAKSMATLRLLWIMSGELRLSARDAGLPAWSPRDAGESSAAGTRRRARVRSAERTGSNQRASRVPPTRGPRRAGPGRALRSRRVPRIGWTRTAGPRRRRQVHGRWPGRCTRSR